MPGNPKALKRNDREYKEILIGPSMAPRFFGTANSAVVFFLAAQKSMSASGQISRCGWQADDRIFQGNGRSDIASWRWPQRHKNITAELAAVYESRGL